MSIRGLVVLAGLLACGGVHAKDYPERMTFTEFRPCAGAAPACAPVYLAQGQIDPGAADRLAELLRSRPDHPRTIAFDSPGGSLIVGLDMGRLIRAQGLNTLVAPRHYAGNSTELVADDAGCYSACAYAFMGGVSRTIAPGGQIGVHQFAGLGAADTEANAQVGVAMLSKYVQSMGVDRELLDVASITGAGEMVVVPEDYARRYGLDNQSPPLGAWQIKALGGGSIGLSVDQRKAGANTSVLLVFTATDDPKLLQAIVLLRGIDVPGYEAMLQDMIGKTSVPRICMTDYCMTFMPVTAWEMRGAQELLGTFTISTADLIALSPGSEPMWLEAGFPPRYESLGPSVLLSRAELQDGLASLLRH